jgi:hypothetical protein
MAASLELRLSGGASNTDPDAALGGARSTAGGGVVPTSLTANSIFDDVTGAEEAAGDLEYRGLFIYNAGDVDAQNTVVWISANTSDSGTQIAIALADEAIGTGSIETIANENTAPSGPSFTEPATEGAALSIGTIPAGSHKGVWVRRDVDAGAGASNDTFTLASAFDTAP